MLCEGWSAGMLLATLYARFKDLVRSVLLNLRPLRDRPHDEPGYCTACGAVTRFAFNSWTTPDELHREWNDPAVSDAYNRRESMFCRSCCANLRVRRIAEVLINLYGPACASFAGLVNDPALRGLDVAEVNTIGSLGSLHALLQWLPRLSFSSYAGPDHLGEMVDGARNEDISQLTYPDASFDLILSSDTLEHVPDFRAALAETRRVLRPGGRHVFTVPVVWSRPTTEIRARLDNGQIVHLMPPLYHGRGSGAYRYIPVGEDMLAFTEFGRDITDHIRAAGFEPEIYETADPTGAETVFAGRA